MTIFKIVQCLYERLDEYLLICMIQSASVCHYHPQSSAYIDNSKDHVQTHKRFNPKSIRQLRFWTTSLNNLTFHLEIISLLIYISNSNCSYCCIYQEIHPWYVEKFLHFNTLLLVFAFYLQEKGRKGSLFKSLYKGVVLVSLFLPQWNTLVAMPLVLFLCPSKGGAKFKAEHFSD